MTIAVDPTDDLTKPSKPLLALSVTLAVQTLAAVSQSVPAVLAPAIAPAFGVPAAQIGLFTGFLYIFAMFSGLLCSGYINRYGAVRISQIGLLLAAVGLALIAIGKVSLLIVSAAVIGIGYGLANPTAALILGNHAPAHRRGLYFSLKQTGVPIGIALTGVVAPALYQWFGWHSAVVMVAVVCLAVALAIQPTVVHFDDIKPELNRPKRPSLWAPLKTVFADSRLRLIGLVSLTYAFIQVCLITFLVAYLTVEHKMSLTLAAAVLAVGQLTSIAGRPFWGWLADRSGQPARLLGLLGLGMGAACLVLAFLPSDASSVRVFFTAIACAGTGIAWNGVFYAELVRNVKSDQLASVTGGTQFLTFTGGMIGPIVFSIVVTQSGQYWLAFALMAVLPIIAGSAILFSSYKSGNTTTEFS